MHEGSVKAFSAGPGQGSEFVVRLPILAGEQPQPPVVNGSTPALEPQAKHRVLVVDDNVDAADSLAILVGLDGHEVVTAHDGFAALQTAQTFHPEIILLDIGLPRMDGYEVARRLRAQARGREFILAAVTGYGHNEDRLRAQEAGFDHHLVKPVDPEVLRQVIATINGPEQEDSMTIR
jgi:two-component system CheB/CheR fusion protein